METQGIHMCKALYAHTLKRSQTESDGGASEAHSLVAEPDDLHFSQNRRLAPSLTLGF